SSRCGSADVIEALGIPIDLTPEMQSTLLRDVGIAFLFAPAHHPALKHAGAARKELGVRTIFNALGPLANPARATHQLVGVYDDALRSVMARALGKLGVKRAWVVRAEDGLDEISTDAPTRVSELREDGTVHERVVHALEFESPQKIRRSIEGSSAEANAAEITAIFDRGSGEHPAKSSVVINAGAALLVAGVESDPRTATERARAAIDRGDAKDTLSTWRAAARKLAGLE
ncbi:MAG: anthranilate phosphoribosyltransferase, partial [Polyangiaceae bacterium]